MNLNIVQVIEIQSTWHFNLKIYFSSVLRTIFPGNYVRSFEMGQDFPITFLRTPNAESETKKRKGGKLGESIFEAVERSSSSSLPGTATQQPRKGKIRKKESRLAIHPYSPLALPTSVFFFPLSSISLPPSLQVSLGSLFFSAFSLI